MSRCSLGNLTWHTLHSLLTQKQCKLAYEVLKKGFFTAFFHEKSNSLISLRSGCLDAKRNKIQKKFDVMNKMKIRKSGNSYFGKISGGEQQILVFIVSQYS